MEVNFYLQQGKYIYLQAYYGSSGPFRISCRRKCPARYWNARRGRSKGAHPQHKQLNAFLDKLSDVVKGVEYAASMEGRRPTESEFREALAPFLNLNVSRKKRYTLREYFYHLHEQRRESPNFSKNTVSRDKTALKHLEAFGFPNWDEVTLDWFHEFTNYLFAQGMKQNSLANIVSVIKTFLNVAVDRKHTTNLAHKHPEFSMPFVKPDKVYLTTDELIDIYHADLSGYLDKTRDLALVGAFTGQRFGDWKRIKPENFHETKHGTVFKFKTEKSGNRIEVVVPVHPVLRSIIDKHGGRIPEPISNQKFNRYIKELCRVVGIDAPVQITTTKGGVSKLETHPKYSLVTSHTLRRSFITNALVSGIPDKVVMDVVGHTKYETLMRYNVLEKERSAQVVAQSDFFKGDRFLRRAL